MLVQTAPARAYDYFLQNLYVNIATQDELMQLAVIELVRKEGIKSEGQTKVCLFSLVINTPYLVLFDASCPCFFLLMMSRPATSEPSLSFSTVPPTSSNMKQQLP